MKEKKIYTAHGALKTVSASNIHIRESVAEPEGLELKPEALKFGAVASRRPGAFPSPTVASTLPVHSPSKT